MTFNVRGIEPMSRSGAPKEGWYAVFLMNEGTVRRVRVGYEDEAIWFLEPVDAGAGEEPDTTLHEIAGFFHDEFFPEQSPPSGGDKP